MWYFIIGIIILYVAYRLCVSIVFPKMSERSLKNYRKDFFKKNQHINSDKFPPLKGNKD